MKKLIFLSLVLALALSAAHAPVRQTVTSGKAAFKYQRSDTTACTWEASVNPTFTPAVPDLQTSNSDSGEDGTRYFIIGTNTALSPETTYYWRQTCGAEVYTGQFTTLASIPPDPIDMAFSTGGTEAANKMQIDYGSTPALGSTLTVDCTPRCTASIPSQKDALLFVRWTYKNETDVVAGPGPVHLLANR